MSTKPPLVVIAGPTASGKSALALALSRLTPSVIINADASQVYRDLRILTARPTPEEEAECPHRLFGHIDGAVACSAADWADEARAAVREAHLQGRLPVLAGGSGLYIRTLLEGIAPVPPIDPEVRGQVRALPLEEAYASLTREDRDAAARLSPADATRIARALEVVRSTGRTLAAWQAERSGGIDAEVETTGLVLLPPRDWLYGRCDRRFEAMLDGGAVEEVEALLARDLDPALPAMRAIGVREIAAMLEGRTLRSECEFDGRSATRRYAKRQYTWFRHQPPAAWQREHSQLDYEQVTKRATKLLSNVLTR